jgi:hypothetical protein
MMVEAKKFDWAAGRIQQRQKFAEMLDDEKLRRDVFNEKYFEGLERRMDQLKGFHSKIQLIQWTGILLLALAVLSVHIPISLFGLSTGDAHSVREILLLILATVPLAALSPSLQEANVTEQLEVYADKISEGNAAVRRAVRARYGLSNEMPRMFAEGGPPIGFRQLPTLLSGGIGIIGFFLMTFVVFTSIEIAAMIDIVRNPTISTRVSWLVILYVCLAFAMNSSIRKMHGINPNQITGIAGPTQKAPTSL